MRKTETVTCEDGLNDALRALRGGDPAAVPGETSPCLAVRADCSGRARDGYGLAEGAEERPLPLLVEGQEGLTANGTEIPPAAYTLAEKFWPGSLILAVKAGTNAPEALRTKEGTVWLRCPDHPLTRRLIRECGMPLACLPADPSGREEPESAVIDVSTVPFRLLRGGIPSREEIEKTLMSRVRCVGLTGGTGSGKTTVLRYLTGRGALGLDCDVLYHELLKTCLPMRAELRERFPAAFSGGVLDRKRLGQLVFSDAGALKELNAVTHRYVKAEAESRLRELAWKGGGVAVIDAVALFESGLAGLCEFTVGVTADKEVRLRRIMAREGIGEDYARTRIAAQKPDSWFIGKCTYVLTNNGTAEDLERRCGSLFGGLYAEPEKTTDA